MKIQVQQHLAYFEMCEIAGKTTKWKSYSVKFRFTANKKQFHETSSLKHWRCFYPNCVCWLLVHPNLFYWSVKIVYNLGGKYFNSDVDKKRKNKTVLQHDATILLGKKNISVCVTKSKSNLNRHLLVNILFILHQIYILDMINRLDKPHPFLF